MFRIVFQFILIANLLVCPLKCASCQAVSGDVDSSATERESSEQEAASACTCCQHKKTSGEKSDDSPDRSCDCPNCLCDGATLQSGIPLLSKTTSHGHFLPSMQAVSLNVKSTTGTAAAGRQDATRHEFRRRNARIEFQVWRV